MQEMTLHGKLLEKRYGLISGKEKLSNEEKIDCFNRSRGTVDIQWSVSGILFHPLAGCIFEIIGGLLNLCFFIMLLAYAKKYKKK